ncbi:hypothetical protein JN531_003940 [Flagellatimonas centrodinii]|uniref:hypothetical protein n=1 Tax=Flagellatimonas centrodinii TaxID=2806210 RepID=UPI001FFD1734|nr:hypothetical protein [Flagellatimonas centrodinii]ULQ47438.1 hypothetical protein JN531_003940 [Flagellatimonas centrodinii]
MKKITERFATFYSPGLLFAETSTVAVNSLDPLAVKWPNTAYAFTLHEREDVVDGDSRFTGTARQIGPTYYHPDSKVETLAEVRASRPNANVLISNMESNRWDKIIWSRWGNWPQPFEDGKAVVLGASA